ncbi:hypothetical protein BY458DRAFT_502303 [Sporodiniella umbellata]|nr:hypothetical protein BY458DRAFT_502303 [Sporodiniella umbellata]
MKLSFSILLLAAAMQVQCAVTPNAASKCISGSFGKNNGDGYKNYCCKNSDDCRDTCVKGVCNGPVNTKTVTTTTAPKPTTTPTCTEGSKGLKNGDGYKGYCCKNSDDCRDTCVKGVCNGPVNTKTVTTTTAPKPTTTPTCTEGSKGLKNGDGYKGDCCKTNDDCTESCVNGVCNGPVNPNPKPSECLPGYKGKDNGKGPFNACCESSDDCKEACVKGRCTKP